MTYGVKKFIRNRLIKFYRLKGSSLTSSSLSSSCVAHNQRSVKSKLQLLKFMICARSEEEVVEEEMTIPCYCWL